MIRYGFESAMLSFIEMLKIKCINKETCDILYGISSDEKENKRIDDREDLSVVNESDNS